LLHTNIEIGRLEKQRDLLLVRLSDARSDDEAASLTKNIDKLAVSIDIAKEPLESLKKEESERLIFRSRAKWSEDGEKSTKYFFNLIKERQARMTIRKIISNGITLHNKDEITKAIETFYKQLYEKQPNLKPPHESDFLQDLPQLSDNQRNNLEQPVTLAELENALKTCKESAPGYDGITYGIYKQLWPILGSYVYESWNYSNNVGKTSQSQHHAIISLLEKKGKDRTKIENLRPISLSNCDIKICTKAIAIRTNAVLESIIGPTQTGYVPGRQVNDNNRLIEEVIHHYENIRKKAYLITLDAQKAFDSVDHHYLLSCLRAFNFPESYIRQVSTIYSDLTAAVLINGHMSNKFDIKQSVKQGDALSCSLFIIAMEPLLRKFNSTNGIKPIVLNPGNDHEFLLTNVSYADDITILCENEGGLQAAITLYEKFSKISGVKLNVPKTEVLIVGAGAQVSKVFEIRYGGNTINIRNQNSVKICGITYATDKNESYTQNVSNKITKLERQLNIWRQRNLSLEGKILIAKTFGLSQVIYSMQAVNFKTEDIKKIENIIYKFIWNIKPSSTSVSGRIKRPTLQCCKREGGLNAPNINAINEAIKYKICLRHLTVNHPINQLTGYLLYAKNKSFNNNWNDIPDVNDFIDTALNAHNKISSCIDKDIAILNESEQMIHKEYFQFLANYPLKNIKYFNRNQAYLVNNLRAISVYTLGQLKKHYESNNNRLFFESSQIWRSTPIQWRNLMSKSRRWSHYVKDDINLEYICVGFNKWVSIDKVKTCELKQRLQSITKVPKNANAMNTKFNTTLGDDINPFSINNNSTCNVKIKNVQYKILHNAYPTMSHLYNWRIKTSPNCTLCQVQESIEHAIWTCPVAQHAVNTLIDLIHNLTHRRINISKNEFIFGIPNMHSLNVIFVLLKRTLILQREDKHFLNIDNIKKLITDEMRVEKFISLRKNNMNLFYKNWSMWTALL
jgi:hypothetical protein